MIPGNQEEGSSTRFIIALFVTAMLVLITACGGSSSGNGSDDDTEETDTEQEEGSDDEDADDENGVALPGTEDYEFTELGPIPEASEDFSEDFRPKRLTTTDDALYFVADEEGGIGPQVWTTDGTDAGTEALTEIYDDFGQPHALTTHNGDLYFMADRREDLMLLDESEPGGVNRILQSILWYPQAERGEVAITDNTIFFAMDNTDDPATDGHEVHTVPVGAADPDPESIANINGEGSSNPDRFTVAGDQLFFAAQDEDDEELYEYGLWVTEGAEDGATRLATIHNYPGDDFFVIMALGDRVLFRRDASGSGTLSGLDNDPWVSDGTQAGTEPLVADASMTGHFAKLDENTAIFRAGGAVWKTDGTTEGTEELLASGSVGSKDNAVLDGKLYYSGSPGVWVTDGTTEGTEFVTDSGTHQGSTEEMTSPDHFTALDGKIYFTSEFADSDLDGRHLWVTDGTEEGTRTIAPSVATNDEPIDAAFDFHFSMEVHDGALYVPAEYTDEGPKLWQVTPVD